MSCASSRFAEAVVIGHGLAGAVAARTLHDVGLDVLVVDAGTPISATPATHVRNLDMCRTDTALRADLVRTLLRPVSFPPARSVEAASPPVMPDGNGINTVQRRDRNMTAARTTSAFGGMGILWNCFAPRPDPCLEQWHGIDMREWELLYTCAEELLAVGADLATGSRRHEFVLNTLRDNRFPAARHAPIAASAVDGRIHWTGPADIIDHAPITVRHATVRRLDLRGGRVRGAQLLDSRTGVVSTLEADIFVVAAGAIRTPALLWASGMRDPDSALGRYLTDHPLAFAQVVLDPDMREDGFGACVEVPVDHDHPFHRLVVSDGHDSPMLEGRIDDRLILSLYWYTSSEPRFDNRIVFDSAATDSTGLPQPTFDYTLTHDDRARHRAALDDLRATAALLGTTVPTSPPQLTSPGASMHLMGTTRMSITETDGVTDSFGRVWGADNLYVAGTGLIPVATAANPTLTACALAVRTAQAIAHGTHAQ